MKSIKEIKQEIDALKKQQEELEERIKEIIYNAMIKIASSQVKNRISDHMSVISSKDFYGKPWTMSYHDYEESARAVYGYLQSIRPVKWLETLQERLDVTKRTRRNWVEFNVGPSYSKRNVKVSIEFIEAVIAEIND